MVAVKSTLEKPDVEQILAYYDVGVIEDVKAFTTGTVQTNILLHTTRGRFVLRYTSAIGRSIRCYLKLT